MTLSFGCGECGKAVFRYPSQVKGNRFGTFCNRRCLGKFRSRKLTGEWAANYKSGFKRDREYIMVEARWHPFANKTGYVSLHRLIYEAKAQRFLDKKLVVHHKDGDRRNNHWDNLSAMKQVNHARVHAKERKRGADGRF